MNFAKRAGAHRRPTLRTPAAVALGALVTLGIALVALPARSAPPAGAPIGNQATATYLDAASTSHTVTSNPVTTIVQQVASLTLTADGVRTAAPGASASFPHDLTNTGNGTDNFNLTLVNLGGDIFDLSGPAIYADADGNGVPDNFTPLASTGPLAAGAVFRFVVVGTVPGAQVGGDFAQVRITATSVFDGTQTTFNTDRVNVTGNAVISVTKSISAPSGNSPSGPYTYTLSYNNTGNATAGAVRLTDLIPAGMTYVAGSARWSVTGAAVLTDIDSTDAQGVAPATVRYDFNVATAGAVTAILNQVPPGQSGTVTFQVNVNPGLGPQTIDNSARYAYNDGAANVGPFFTNLAPFTVAQTVSLTFTGQTVASALQGAVVSFSNTLTNTGNGTDVFDVTTGGSTFPAGTTFQLFQSDGVTPLSDSNGNGIPDTGPLAAGASTAVVMRATLPTAASGGPWQVQKTARSASDPLQSAVATDVLTSVAANTVDLTNNSPLPGAPGAGAGPEASFVDQQTVLPGNVARFTLYVNNTSGQPDNFNLDASTDPTFAALTLPAGWSVVFRNAANAVIVGTGAIPAGGNMLVYADVSVPAGFAAGNVEIYFRSLSPLYGDQDRIHDQVGVGVVRSLSLVPNNSAQVIPGGFVIYSHLLTNTGNVLEGGGAGSFVALTHADDQAGWSSALYWDTNGSGAFDAGDQPISDLSSLGGLAPGASLRLFVQVFSPAGAPLGQLNTTTVTATTTNVGYVTPVPAPASATDGTTIINGQLTITKTQALDADCNGVEDAPFSPVNINAGAIPGACIRYEITVTNIGSTPVTGVVVNDATPANTTASNSASAFASQGSIVVPADGTTGSITANLGLIAPGATATIRFNIRINP
jgi:uncharacterized repeat protein (TIGR01451 family)